VNKFTGTAAQQAEFLRSFEAIQEAAHTVNRANGWWQERETINRLLADQDIDNTPHMAIELLGLVTSEVAEAMEAARKHDPVTWGDPATKDTLVRELAGTIVRCMDLAQFLNAPLAEAIIQEITANAERGFRHGGKAA